MHIGCTVQKIELILTGYMGIMPLTAIISNMGSSDFFRFFHCLFRPGTGKNIITGGTLRQEIHRHHGELKAGAALKEQHPNIITKAHQFFHIGFGFRHYGIKGFGTVTDGQHTHAGTGKIIEFFFGFAQNFFIDHRRTGIKIVYLFYQEG